MVRRWFFALSIGAVALVLLLALVWPASLWALVAIGPLILIGLYHSLQTRHTVLRNFPLIGYGRYLMEMVRPEVQQYFIETSTDAYPVEREYRDVIYQRAKGELETRPYGTHRDVYSPGYEWAAHSVAPRSLAQPLAPVTIGADACSRPYRASLLNISAMSFGSISRNAVQALNRGARKGGFAHNTGEGGISSHHLQPGGDLIWQLGTAYFGCRSEDGGFDPQQYRRMAARDSVRMTEIKLSQGAKPGHGGVLPGVKVNAEIARARGVPEGKTIVSPPGHSAFSTPLELLAFIAQLRELSGGKPVGIKICIGHPGDLFALCRAMLETDILPDFITVDGGEGGTGAAPLEFSNSVGMPAHDALVLVHGALRGVGLRDRVKIIASGKIFTGFHIVRALALGADLCASARAMMLALGCIQSLRCNTNRCPTGVTTQNPALEYGLHVAEKSERVYRYHRGTLRGVVDLLESMGLETPQQLCPRHIYRRTATLGAAHYGEIYPILEPGQLREERNLPEHLHEAWRRSRPDRWDAP